MAVAVEVSALASPSPASAAFSSRSAKQVASQHFDWLYPHVAINGGLGEGHDAHVDGESFRIFDWQRVAQS
ncbi:hypothetical protein BBK36DRAFT_1136757 [Trichoderma citrinoviride]|uniref:Uncharacterized protein n=1 Tax=Trichoderma citrinoviride TaxID=58853 RepID=A0A2T4AWT3_9HYPO|nr:hypothetical protein BBK36DRAFT_1136757 [Trichoderma citrinoviride]PTB61527.1 hypothetical protein BBK36DRAFT_1136757 [Trichoderma citrinoviride]